MKTAGPWLSPQRMAAVTAINPSTITAMTINVFPRFFIGSYVKVLLSGQVGVTAVETVELLPVSSDDLFALSLFVCCHVLHGGMRQQA